VRENLHGAKFWASHLLRRGREGSFVARHLGILPTPALAPSCLSNEACTGRTGLQWMPGWRRLHLCVLSPCPLDKGWQRRTKAQAAAAQHRAQGRPRPPGAPAASTTRRGRPGARLCLRGRAGPGPQEAGAIVRSEPGTAPQRRVATNRPAGLQSSQGRRCHRGGRCVYCYDAFYYVRYVLCKRIGTSHTGHRANASRKSRRK
jgi:hypothetical protein